MVTLDRSDYFQSVRVDANGVEEYVSVQERSTLEVGILKRESHSPNCFQHFWIISYIIGDNGLITPFTDDDIMFVR